MRVVTVSISANNRKASEALVAKSEKLMDGDVRVSNNFEGVRKYIYGRNFLSPEASKSATA